MFPGDLNQRKNSVVLKVGSDFIELSQLLFAGAVVLCLSKLRCYLDLRLQRACAIAVGAAAGAFWVLERSLLL